MVTLVGTQKHFTDAVKELLELDYDAKEAYEAAINRLDNHEYKSQMEKFKNDHERHIKELTELLKAHNEEYPTGPSSKQWLAKGKVVLANLIGDKTILSAMRTNEIDTNYAYERLYEYDDIWIDAKPIIKKGLSDERRHKAWLDDILFEDQ